MRRVGHSRRIPKAPPCGLCFLGKWLMSYDLKRNLGLKPTNRHFTGQSSVAMAVRVILTVAEIEQEGERLSFEPAVRFGHFELDREINNLPLDKPARKHTNSGIENACYQAWARGARHTGGTPLS